MNYLFRSVKKILEPTGVVEGAGVKLRRSIATRTLDYIDPFLLFDHFGSENPEDYIAGFPMHPHRGIETVTYMISGTVNHKDSIGNTGSIGSGDVQWMTSGRGIMHEEMPQACAGELIGFQLWINLPADLKMTQPRYQEFTSNSIPTVKRDNGSIIKILAGEMDGVKGPVTGIAADPVYIDVNLPAESEFTFPLQKGHSAFAYVFEGKGFFGVSEKKTGNEVASPQMVLLSDGDTFKVRTENQPVRFLLISGKPLNEPVARYGPFVMNTRQEIEEALSELRAGTFIK